MSMDPPLILAIDPGPERSAWVLLSTTWGRPLAHADDVPNAQLLDWTHPGKSRLDSELAMERLLVVVEEIEGMGMAVGKETFQTVWWAGRIFQSFDSRGASATMLARKPVKLHLCGKTNAKDPNVRMALLDRFGPGKERAIGKKSAPGPLYGIAGHRWAALALAVTFFDRMNRA